MSRPMLGTLAVLVCSSLACADEGDPIARAENLLARLSALEQDHDALERRLFAVEAENEELKKEHGCPGDCLTQADLTTALRHYVRDDVLAGELAAYITERDLEEALEGVAMVGHVEQQIDADELADALRHYVKDSDPRLEQAVDLSGFATLADLAGYATLADVADHVVADALADFVRLVTTSRTIEVPGDEPTVQAALASLDGWAIAHDATVTIDVADGTYQFPEPLEVTHRDGARIRIIGNPGSPGSVVFEASGSAAILVRDNRSLGWLEGVTLRGTDTDTFYGIEARDGGYVRAGRSNANDTAPPIIAEGFAEAGIAAYRNGTIFADFALLRDNTFYGAEVFQGGTIRVRNAIAEHNGEAGFGAFNDGLIDARSAIARENGNGGFDVGNGAVIDARFSRAEDNGSESSPYSFGYSAGNGAVLRAEGSVAEGNFGSGFDIWNGGVLRARDSVASDNGGSGFQAGLGSVIDAFQAVASGNGENGFSAHASVINAPGSTASDNTQQGFDINNNSALEASFSTVDDNGGSAFVGRQTSVLQVVAAHVEGNGHNAAAPFRDDAVHCAGAWCFFEFTEFIDNFNDVIGDVFWLGQGFFQDVYIEFPDGGSYDTFYGKSIIENDHGGTVIYGDTDRDPPTPWWVQ